MGGSKQVHAAGGVLWRHADGVEVAVVHRPGYDDWTLPKGKVDDGEILPMTAVREIAEETGYSVRLGPFLADVTYPLSPSRIKHVRYFAAEATGGRFAPGDEVDELRWCSVEEAEALLTYELDREVLDEFVALPRGLRTFLVIRHARAGSRSQWDADDRLRPLDETGRRQADALAGLLNAFGAATLHAADRVRCHQTLQPLADLLGTTIIDEPTLSEEAYLAEPTAAETTLRALAADASTVHAVCSQGKVIPPLLEKWAADEGFPLPDSRNRKGSVWIMSIHDGTVVAVHHIDRPLPH